jgi:uncharacterized protein
VHVDLAELLVALTAVLIGSLVQGSIGFGLNMLAAPFVALVVPEALPTTLVLVAFPLALSTAAREHENIDRREVSWLLLGAIPGTLLGLLILTQVSEQGLVALIGGITLIGVALSFVSPPIRVTLLTGSLAGFLSNLFGTAAAVGGPPVALLFQHHGGRVARPTISAFFTASAALSLVGYALAGTMHVDQVLFALALVPAMLLGLWASKHLHPFVDGGWLRPVVLALSAVAGCAALVRGLG